MSRASVVGMLIAAEILIVGMAIFALGRGGTSFAAGLHHVAFTPSAIAPVAAGSEPTSSSTTGRRAFTSRYRAMTSFTCAT